MVRSIPTIVNQTILCGLGALICLFSRSAAMAQDVASSPPPSSDYVSREEYDKLKTEHEAMKTEHEAMKKELDALKTAVQQMANGTVPGAPPEGTSPAASPSEGKQVVTTTPSQPVTPSTEPAVSTEPSGPLATHSFSIVGDAEVQFGKISGQHGAFMLADFAPIFLFRGGDKILFEAGFDFILQNNAPGSAGSTTTVNLSFATLDYLINDYITFVGGNMLLPLGTYSERSAGWLNKFPDAPLPRAVLPGNGVGLQLLQRLIAESEALGYRQMIAVIGDSANAGSIGVHARCGFQMIGTHPNVGFKFGRWVDVGYWQRVFPG